MQLQLEGVDVYLQAADARYHKNCYKTFTNVRNINVTQRKLTTTDNKQDEAIEKIISAIRQHLERMWSSVELQKLYQ